MRLIIQRVKSAKCIIGNKVYSEIEAGYLLYVGFTHSDNLEDCKKAAAKIATLRLFSDSDGKINLPLQSISGQVLSISQFSLYADATNGNRPSFSKSLGYSEASKLYDIFNELLIQNKLSVKVGLFGADMIIKSENDGPLTIIYQTKEEEK